MYICIVYIYIYIYTYTYITHSNKTGLMLLARHPEMRVLAVEASEFSKLVSRI